MPFSSIFDSFPFNLDNTQFFYFFLISFVLINLAYYFFLNSNGKRKAQQFIRKNTNLSPYDLAYLYDGSLFCMQVLISDLIMEKNISKKDNHTFEVHNKNLFQHPISAYLYQHQIKEISIIDLLKIAEKEVNKKNKQFAYQNIEKLNKPNRSIYLFAYLFLAAITALRLYQIWDTREPFAALGICIFISVLIFIVIHGIPYTYYYINAFYKKPNNILQFKLSAFQYQIFSKGFNAICVGSPLYILYPYFLDYHRHILAPEQDAFY